MTISNVSFRANETTGGVADRTVETAKQETTGGVGVRKNNDSIFVDNELKQDTVCFKAAASQPEQKKSSPLKTFILFLGGAAAIVGGLGLAHKYNVVGKIGNEKARKFFQHTDTVTEPCHKACAWVKTNCWDKVVKFFSSKK